MYCVESLNLSDVFVCCVRLSICNCKSFNCSCNLAISELSNSVCVPIFFVLKSKISIILFYFHSFFFTYLDKVSAFLVLLIFLAHSTNIDGFKRFRRFPFIYICLSLEISFFCKKEISRTWFDYRIGKVFGLQKFPMRLPMAWDLCTDWLLLQELFETL